MVYNTDGLGAEIAEFVTEINRLNEHVPELIDADLCHDDVETRVAKLVGVLVKAGIVTAQEAEEYARRSFKEK